MDENPEEQEIPNGLVAVGGSLDPETLLRAYRAGIFPWSSEPAITWWCPDPRAVIELGAFEPSRSLKKQIRRAGWRFTVDHDFVGVMRACAEPTPERPSTWISEDFIDSYCELHRRGFAHSVEVWEPAPHGGAHHQHEALVGGLYGVTIGGFFGGESMFRRRTDASKAAVWFLVEHLRTRGFTLLDAQVPTPHLESLGAVGIPRVEYLRRLQAALVLPVSF